MLHLYTRGATHPDLEGGAPAWSFRWAGVVMQSGPNSRTRENYAAGDYEARYTAEVYQTYGERKKTGRSFHEQHQDVHKQHGESPTKIAMDRPKLITALALAYHPCHERQHDEDNVMSQNHKPNPTPARASTPPMEDSKPRSSVRFPETMGGSSTLPLVTGQESLEDADEAVVVLRGKYVQVDVRRRPAPPRQLRGHVSIILADGTSVSLFPIWHADAPRPQEEIAAFEGMRVQVVGTAYYEAPCDPSGGASSTSPCVMEIKAMTTTP